LILKALLKKYTILYVEDELNIQKNMAEYLEGYFREVYVASDGEEGLKMYDLHRPNVLLLDIDLPRVDGLTLAKYIRKKDKQVAIIMLTAFTDQEKLLQATELKLLKYLVKPIDLLEFQHTLNLLAIELIELSPNILFLGESLVWDKENEKLLHNGKACALTAKEQELLALLIRHKNKSISFEEIMAHVWVDEFDREISLNCVKNIVSNLRKKLPKESIKNVYGEGYIFQ
jgi:two-component system response regulator VanR